MSLVSYLDFGSLIFNFSITWAFTDEYSERVFTIEFDLFKWIYFN